MSKLKRMLKKDKHKSNYEVTVATNPESSYAESFRKIPIDLKFAYVDKEPRIIQITSSLAGEHKTTTAANLAAVYVELGYKVIVVDCDLRRPKFHRIANVLNDDGLTNYLIDKISFQDLIKKSIYNFDVITAGESVPFPHVALRSEKFKALIEQLRNEYDYIIIDTPPTLLVTDSLIISEAVDTTLFVINQRNTKKSDVKEAIQLLKESNANLSGIILSNVNKRITNYSKYEKYY